MSGLNLPDALRTGPFRLADGLEQGLSLAQLQSPELERPTRGVRMADPPVGLAERARAFALVLPAGAAFSHLTAARLWGFPISAQMESDERLHVMVDGADRRIRRQGVVAHRGLDCRETALVEGLLTVGISDTWVDLGELTGLGNPVGLDDLIVAGDAAAQLLGDVSPLRDAVLRRVRPRGKLMLLPALRMVRLGAESGMETRVRLLFVRAGLPEPELNGLVWTARGKLLGRADMLWRTRRVTAEYQGAQFHSAPDQKRRDRRRLKGFRADGWRVGQIWADDMRTPEARRDCVLRFAHLLRVSEESLNLDACEPPFFSQEYWEAMLDRRARRRHQQRLVTR